MLTLQVLSLRTLRYQAPLICNFEIAALAKVSMDFLMCQSLDNDKGLLDSFLAATDPLIKDFGSGPSGPNGADARAVYRFG